jgi:hypothetical protein
MVQVVENRAWLTCRLIAARSVGDEIELEVWLEGTEPVAGFPDLLAQRAQSQLQVRIAAGPVPEPGSRFKLQARLAGPGLVRGDRASLTPLGT